MSISIVLGSSQKDAPITSLETDATVIKIAPDKQDKIVLVLGINRVEVEHVNGEWEIRHNRNVHAKLIGHDNAKAFVPDGVPLQALS